ncbi:MAG: tetratricopeptide repeat protein, partial [Chitinivibrionales bacterium]|nr:tetratricopeptide repeat protein [Chitinivibrionales bacterium]
KTQVPIGMVWRKTGEGDKREQQAADYKEAIKQFTVVTQESSGSGEADEANYQIADCNKNIGNEKAAREAAKKIQGRVALLKTIKLFGVNADNSDEELKYWEQAYKDALEDEERAQALYEKGMLLTDKMKKYDEAMQAFNRVIEITKDPNKKINAEVAISRIYSLQQKYGAAIDTLTEVLKSKRISLELTQQLQIQLFNNYYNKKDFQKAANGFENFVNQYPQHAQTPFAYYRLGNILAEAKKYKEAMAKFQVILDKYKESNVTDKAVLAIGEQMMNQEQYAEGVAYLEKYIKANPDASVAANIYSKIADTYAKNLNNKEKAQEAYAFAVEHFPDDPQFSFIAYQYGLLLKGLGKDAEAIARFEKVKKQDASVYRASQAEIGNLLAKKDPEAAVGHYRSTLAQSETPEDSAKANMGIGDVYSTVGKWDNAAESFKAVYQQYHGKDTSLSAASLVKLVDAYSNGKRYAEAINAAEEMQRIFPNNTYTPNAQYLEANDYFAQANYTRAREIFQKIIDGRKNEQLIEIARYQKAECIYFAKKFPEAIRGYADYCSQYPQGKYTANAVYMQGNAWWQLEDFAKARERFAEVVNKYPDFAEICNAKNFLAFCLNRLDKWQEAVKLYNDVRKNGRCDKKAVDFANEQRESIVTAH